MIAGQTALHSPHYGHGTDTVYQGGRYEPPGESAARPGKPGFEPAAGGFKPGFNGRPFPQQAADGQAYNDQQQIV